MALEEAIISGLYDLRLSEVYPGADIVDIRARILGAAGQFKALFNETPAMLLSVPGRTELGGNHTDHNHGRVLAGSVNMDMIAWASPREDCEVELHSEGFAPIKMSILELDAVKAEEGSSKALVRGVAAYMQAHGYCVGGFNAYVSSNVLKGSGLSSSAAYEGLITTIFNHLYNDGRMDAIEVAICGRFAENEYFNKPCGLMDQMACAVGGFIAIDLKDPTDPKVTPIPFDFASTGHTLCIVDVKSDHEDLTDAYADIPGEMGAVAAMFGKEALRDVDKNEFFAELKNVRKSCGDRALARSLHFFSEDERAVREAQALKEGDFNAFLALVRESGKSSGMFLQNIYVSGAVKEQAVTIGLALSELLLNGRGACRVHGGGFAGTMQAFVPNDIVEAYRKGMESVFGQNSCHLLSIRALGAIRIL